MLNKDRKIRVPGLCQPIYPAACWDFSCCPDHWQGNLHPFRQEQCENLLYRHMFRTWGYFDGFWKQPDMQYLKL